jgi:hypothetical protein
VKRVVLLIGLITVVVWLAAPRVLLRAATGPSHAVPDGRSGETQPFYVCDGRMCVEQPGCGISACENDQDCAACDPYERWDCITIGWQWDDWSCTCSPPACDPWDEQDCVNNWGSWNSSTCTCSNPCNPGPAEYQSSWSTTAFQWCNACFWGTFRYYEESHYTQFCQDRRVWDDWWTTSADFYYDDFSTECDYWCWEW